MPVRIVVSHVHTTLYLIFSRSSSSVFLISSVLATTYSHGGMQSASNLVVLL